MLTEAGDYSVIVIDDDATHSTRWAFGVTAPPSPNLVVTSRVGQIMPWTYVPTKCEAAHPDHVVRHYVFQEDIPYAVYPIYDTTEWQGSCHDLIDRLIERKVITQAGRYTVTMIPDSRSPARYPFNVAQPTGLVATRANQMRVIIICLAYAVWLEYIGALPQMMTYVSSLQGTTHWAGNWAGNMSDLLILLAQQASLPVSHRVVTAQPAGGVLCLEFWEVTQNPSTGLFGVEQRLGGLDTNSVAPVTTDVTRWPPRKQMPTYICKMSGGSSTKCVLPSSGIIPTYHDHRNTLRDAIAQSTITHPGLYLVITPESGMANAHLFLVDIAMDITEYNPALPSLLAANSPSSANVTHWPPRPQNLTMPRGAKRQVWVTSPSRVTKGL